ncbi:MAG TPA: NUDIX domain-containing protein [Anaerolineae bacterium]|nr:NUDIX domain-containing protein [Anaerolineae bacterium]
MAVQFCARCGTRLIFGPVEGRDREHCPACGYVVYHNPAPVGMAVVEDRGRLLLIRRTIPPLKGYWAPPAGHVEIGESVPEAATRETKEEAGVDVVLDGLLGVYSQADVKVVIIAYRGRVCGGEPKAGADADEVGLFAPGELPVQPPPDPLSATVMDRWFYGVLQEVTAPWREARSPRLRGEPEGGRR